MCMLINDIISIIILTYCYSDSVNFINHHHHHVVLVARISLTSLSSLFPIVSSPQAGLQDNILYPHIVAECKFVLVVLLLHGHCVGVHKSTSLMSSSLLLSAVSCMSGSSNLNSFRDRRQVAVQLVFLWVLPPGLSSRLLASILV